MTRGQGFYAEVDGLELKVEVREDGWYYRLLQIKGGKVLLDWTSAPAPGTSPYQEPEDVKFEAVTTAMGLLKRSDDPHKFFRELTWHSYGPGH